MREELDPCLIVSCRLKPNSIGANEMCCWEGEGWVWNCKLDSTCWMNIALLLSVKTLWSALSARQRRMMLASVVVLGRFILMSMSHNGLSAAIPVAKPSEL